MIYARKQLKRRGIGMLINLTMKMGLISMKKQQAQKFGSSSMEKWTYFLLQ
jgi:hypothetical protein